MPAMKAPEAKTILIRGGSIPAGDGASRSYVHILRDIFTLTPGIFFIRPAVSDFSLAIECIEI